MPDAEELVIPPDVTTSVQDDRSINRVPPSATPIEMSTMPPLGQALDTEKYRSPSKHLNPGQLTKNHPISPTIPDITTTTSLEADSQQEFQQSSFPVSDFGTASQDTLGPTPPSKVAASAGTTHLPLQHENTTPAIGPATEKPVPAPDLSDSHGPVLFLTLLLTTGARHPFRLDEKYLKKRNVDVEGNNPINLSLYKFKELILRDWREEWEAKPSSPEAIRLISMGKLLGDKAKLADYGFKNGLNPHIIHMTIKPQEVVEEEDAKSSTRDREGNERNPGCRCVIQ